jgi:hypothetical protein
MLHLARGLLPRQGSLPVDAHHTRLRIRNDRVRDWFCCRNRGAARARSINRRWMWAIRTISARRAAASFADTEALLVPCRMQAPARLGGARRERRRSGRRACSRFRAHGQWDRKSTAGTLVHL